jgi:hypothetical protein
MIVVSRQIDAIHRLGEVERLLNSPDLFVLVR